MLLVQLGRSGDMGFLKSRSHQPGVPLWVDIGNAEHLDAGSVKDCPTTNGGRCRRGALLVSTETTVVDDSGRAVKGSKEPFLKKRTEGTERADKAAPEAGVAKFFGGMPTWELYTEPSNVDVVVVPAIDGNFAPNLAEMIPFERQFQTLHSLQNYFLLNELLAPGWPMPVVDNDPLRKARAAFLERFSERPYYFVRAATPQVLMDELDKVI